MGWVRVYRGAASTSTQRRACGSHRACHALVSHTVARHPQAAHARSLRRSRTTATHAPQSGGVTTAQSTSRSQGASHAAGSGGAASGASLTGAASGRAAVSAASGRGAVETPGTSAPDSTDRPERHAARERRSGRRGC